VSRGFFKKVSDTWTLQRDIEGVHEAATKYVRSQTIEPLKALGRYVQFGCAGSLFVGIGGVLVLVGFLRLLQTSTSVFHGHLSWIPYVIVCTLAVVVLSVVALIIGRGPAARRRRGPSK
jgi:hypothetical protein